MPLSRAAILFYEKQLSLLLYKSLLFKSACYVAIEVLFVVSRLLKVKWNGQRVCTQVHNNIIT